jgi:4-diphosphocytidyl-2-C-methyl-D-erythritol kinase
VIVEKAPAKINLALHVRHRRPDGYHAIETLFAFLTDGDEVRVERTSPSPFRGFAAPSLSHREREGARAAQRRGKDEGDDGHTSLTITGPFAAGLSTDDNLVLRAAEAFTRTYGDTGPYAITLDKHLPVASGIGGGSADAAATLRALARLNDIARDDPRLIACAETLGSDVPACLFGRTALGKGRGEALTPVEGLTGTPVLLVNPGVAVSTAKVFAAWDGTDHGPIAEGPLLDRARAARNDLEAPARTIAPAIDEVLAALTRTGDPLLARMSGSGATCFGLYPTETGRASAAAAIRQAHPDWWTLESALA